MYGLNFYVFMNHNLENTLKWEVILFAFSYGIGFEWGYTQHYSGRTTGFELRNQFGEV